MTDLEYIPPLFIKTFKRKFREWIAKFGVQHLHGIKQIRLHDNEAAVTCLLKNGQYYIEAFIDHYLKLGFRHIFLLDNGSTDETIRLAEQYPCVSIYRTALAVGKYQGLLKKIIAQKTIIGGWCLDADIDEFFDYPFSDCISLSDLLTYLNTYGYSAVVTQMLDLFSDKPLSHLALNVKHEDVRSAYRMYDLSEIEAIAYSTAELVQKFAYRNRISNSAINLLFGGIRKKLYGLNCLLTKHSLFSMQKKYCLFPHVHFIDNADIADISAVLRHYKLTCNAIQVANQNKSSFNGTSQGYSDFINLILTKPESYIADPTAKELKHVNQLIDQGFIVISSRYKEFVNFRSRKRI